MRMAFLFGTERSRARDRTGAASPKRESRAGPGPGPGSGSGGEFSVDDGEKMTPFRRPADFERDARERGGGVEEVEGSAATRRLREGD